MNGHEYFAKMRRKAYLVVKGLSKHIISSKSMSYFDDKKETTSFSKYTQRL